MSLFVNLCLIWLGLFVNLLFDLVACVCLLVHWFFLVACVCYSIYWLIWLGVCLLIYCLIRFGVFVNLLFDQVVFVIYCLI